MLITSHNFLEHGSKKPLTPDGYNLKEIVITNHSGVSKEIRNIVVKFSITESLYSNTLVAKFSVVDSANFFEEFPITGQETIEIKLERKSNFIPNPKNEDLILKFFVTEYPLYGRSGQHTQVYSFSAISPHAFASSFRKISRAYAERSDSEIKKIIVNDLNVPEEKFKLTGEPSSISKGLINIQSPLKAAEWFRAKTFDKDFAPFFLFQTMLGNIQLSSFTSLVQQKAYGKPYIHTTGFSQNAQTIEDYDERATRIIETASDLKLGKIFQGSAGAFASNNNYLDYTSKTYTKYNYQYSKDLLTKNNSLEKKTVLSKSFKTGSEEIDTLANAHCEYTSINSGAYEGTTNYNALRKQTKGITTAYTELLETKAHEVVLCGDMFLNAGRVIELKFQRTMDPQLMKDILDKNPRDIWDQHISGRYLITSAIHNFEGGKYYTNVKVKRDSFSIDIDK